MVAIFPKLLKGATITIQITTIAIIAGVILGIFLALGKLSNKKILRIPATMYIEFFRGTPLFVQVLLVYFGIPGLLLETFGMRLNFSAITAGMVVCSINSAAYVAEIFRAGIQSIDRGQMEASRSLGMTHRQAMRYIILPQAFKRILPPLGNEFIVLIKETSILAVIGVEELTRTGQLHVAVTFKTFSTYFGVALTYLAMTLVISRLVSLMERRLGVSDNR